MSSLDYRNISEQKHIRNILWNCRRENFYMSNVTVGHVIQLNLGNLSFFENVIRTEAKSISKVEFLLEREGNISNKNCNLFTSLTISANLEWNTISIFALDKTPLEPFCWKLWFLLNLHHSVNVVWQAFLLSFGTKVQRGRKCYRNDRRHC